MTAYLKACRLPDLRLETLRSRRSGERPTPAASSCRESGGSTTRSTTCGFSRPTDGARPGGTSTQERIWAVKQWLQILTPAVALIVGLAGVVIGLLSMWRWP